MIIPVHVAKIRKTRLREGVAKGAEVGLLYTLVTRMVGSLFSDGGNAGSGPVYSRRILICLLFCLISNCRFRDSLFSRSAVLLPSTITKVASRAVRFTEMV